MTKLEEIDQLIKDLYLLRSTLSERNEKRVDGYMKRQRALLYPALVFELNTLNRPIPVHIDKICHRCKKYNPFCVQGDGGNTCPGCQEKKIPKPYRAAVMLHERGKPTPRQVGVVEGETIPDMVSQFGKFAIEKGYVYFRPVEKDYGYENLKGSRMWISGQIKRSAK